MMITVGDFDGVEKGKGFTADFFQDVQWIGKSNRGIVGGDANCTITDQKNSFQFIFRGEACRLISEMEYVRIALKQGKIVFLPGDSNGGYKVSHSKVSQNVYVRYSKGYGDITDFVGDHELRMNGEPTFYYIRKKG